jgi:hypothetical protein
VQLSSAKESGATGDLKEILHRFDNYSTISLGE